jgi:hypothetical protein
LVTGRKEKRQHILCYTDRAIASGADEGQQQLIDWEFRSPGRNLSEEACSVMILTQSVHCPQNSTKLYRLSDRRLSVKLLPTFAVVSMTDPYGSIVSV